MTKEEFKQRWEKNETGDGITLGDTAQCAEEWGLFARPDTSPIYRVLYAVLKAAGTVDAEEFNPDCW